MSSPKYLVATEPLYVGTARAHNTADLVLAESVEENGWAEQTVSPQSKIGKQLLGIADEPKASASTAVEPKPSA